MSDLTDNSKFGFDDIMNVVDSVVELVNGNVDDAIDGFTCDGATWNASKVKSFMKKRIEQYTPQFQNIAQNGGLDAQMELNNLIKNFHAEYIEEKSWLISKVQPAEGCDKDALNSLIPAMDKTLNDFLSMVKNAFANRGYNITLSTQKDTYNGREGHSYTFTIPYVSGISQSSVIGSIFGLGGSSSSGTSQAKTGLLPLLLIIVAFLGFTKKGKRTMRKITK